MVTERKLIEFVSGSDISNISIQAVQPYSSLIQSTAQVSGFSIYDKYSVEEKYRGPAISLIFSQTIHRQISGTGTAQLQYYIPQTNSYQQISNLNINISNQNSTTTSYNWIGMQRSTSFDISDYLLTDFKNVQFRVQYDIIFQAPEGASRIFFTQTFQNIPSSTDKLLSYFLKSILMNMALQVSSHSGGCHLGFNITAKGEAIYQPSIIGKTLYL